MVYLFFIMLYRNSGILSLYTSWEAKATSNVLTLVIDSKRCIAVQDLVFADVPVPRGTIAIGGLNAYDLIVETAFIHRLHICRLGEDRRKLVHVCHSYMNWHPVDNRL